MTDEEIIEVLAAKKAAVDAEIRRLDSENEKIDTLQRRLDFGVEVLPVALRVAGGLEKPDKLIEKIRKLRSKSTKKGDS